MDDGVGADLEAKVTSLEDEERAVDLGLDGFDGIRRKPLSCKRRSEGERE
jgi:hypothetical protein